MAYGRVSREELEVDRRLGLLSANNHGQVGKHYSHIASQVYPVGMLLAVCPVGIVSLSGLSYPFSMGMKGITIKLPETTLRKLKREARETGRTVAALVRQRVDPPQDHAEGSIFEITSDLAGSLSGGSRPATNKRRRFRRS